jgi:ubiquinone/menaquinone biosynthesis C-methylase UbiE
MEETSSLVIFTKAALLLAEADTIQKAQELKNLALTAADWAKRKGMGEEAIKHCRSYALEAERKMGEMLIQTERAPGAKGIGPIVVTQGNCNKTPTLKELGLTKRESVEAQMMASIPRAEFDEVRDGKKTKLAVKKEVKTQKRNERLAEREQTSMSEKSLKNKFELFHSSVENLDLPEKSIDAIITDPPYGKDYLQAYNDLSLMASRVLKEGGPCLVMTGQAHLEDVLNNLSEFLTYQWTLAYLTPGASVQVFARRIKSNWKPIIFLSNGKNSWEHTDDVIQSDREDKRFHEWGQSVSGMISIIEKFTVKNQTILDPFCGGGSTGVACLLTDRIFIGSDISEGEIIKTKERLISL